MVLRAHNVAIETPELVCGLCKDLWLKIFENLSLKDLLKSVMPVCTEFRDCALEMSSTRLEYICDQEMVHECMVGEKAYDPAKLAQVNRNFACIQPQIRRRDWHFASLYSLPEFLSLHSMQS